MTIKKAFIYLVVFISILTMAGSITAVEIKNPLGVNSVCGLLTKIIEAVAGIVGAISVIMITVAGIMYLVSAGNPEKINSAKSSLKYAIVGMVIAISASVIVSAIKSIINASGGAC